MMKKSLKQYLFVSLEMNQINNSLLIGNVSKSKHEGSYSCEGEIYFLANNFVHPLNSLEEPRF